MIWFRKYTLVEILPLAKGTMLEHLGIELTGITENSVSGKMPVDHRTKQPAGILHGGASVTLAESLGSIASTLVVDPSRYHCVGMEINANHLRPVSGGYVYGEAKPVHIGRRSHVWNIEIVNEEKKLVCISRLTMAIIDKP